MYDDDYSTCAKTFATLRIYGVRPDEVTQWLGLSPTSMQIQGQASDGRRVSVDGWFLSTELQVASRDLRRHLDWLLANISPVATALSELKAQAAKVDVFCYWLSAHGQGGPTFSPQQMKLLGELGLELGLDVYHGS
jgi:hypothetical protein